MTTDFIPTILKFLLSSSPLSRSFQIIQIAILIYSRLFIRSFTFSFILFVPSRTKLSIRLDKQGSWASWNSRTRISNRNCRNEDRPGIGAIPCCICSFIAFILNAKDLPNLKGYALSRIVSFFFPISSRNICEIIDVETVVREKKDRTIRNTTNYKRIIIIILISLSRISII